jgi:hypothetical protein
MPAKLRSLIDMSSPRALSDQIADAGVSEAKESRGRCWRWLGTTIQGAAWIVGCVVLAFAAWTYLVETYDPITGAYYDGLGRELHGGSGVLGLDRSPGLGWELIDTSAAMVVFSMVYGLRKLGERLR